jgi:hypothetical protein
MGYYATNPCEHPENPRCGECDEQMEQVRVRFGPDDWRCTNPDCSECPEAIVMDSLEALVEEVPPEPDTIGVAVACAYGAYDLLNATDEELDIWWNEIKPIVFGG